MSDQYILNDKGIPTIEPNLLKWAKWFQSSDRGVADDTVGDSRISTIFLGIDHASDQNTPILWETMVFKGELDQEQNRCSGSKEQAEAMHLEMVQRVKENQ